MGLKAQGVLRCGRCRKSRGLITHTCVNGRGRKPTRVQSPVQWMCPNCHKPRSLAHTCVTKTDFKKRKRAAARKAATAERRRKRKAVRERQAARRRAAAAERRARDRARRATTVRKATPRRGSGDSHEPGTCGNPDCPKYGCVQYFKGFDAGHGAGYAVGHADGMQEAHAEAG